MKNNREGRKVCGAAGPGGAHCPCCGGCARGKAALKAARKAARRDARREIAAE